MIRRFHFERHEDESGVSGTGKVAEGVLFGEAFYVLHWMGVHKSLVIYTSLAEMMVIHGHEGKTRLVWDDLPPGEEEKEIPKEENGVEKEEEIKDS